MNIIIIIIENGARNCTYLSNRTQNDLIYSMRDLVLKVTGYSFMNN